MARYEDGLIVELEPGEIFVFGSNLAGRHGAGAARQAAQSFGAQYGVGEGLTGRCYAFPTLDEELRRREWKDLTASVRKFYLCADSHPNLTFLLTRVGCGLGGYDEEYMASLFVHAGKHPNVVVPAGW